MTAAVPRTVRGLSLVSLMNDFASEMVYPLLPAFLTGTLGAGPAALGALDGAADLTAAAVKWASGSLADRRGWRKPLILAGYGTAVLIRPVIAVAGAAWQVIAFRVLDRIGKGLRSPARDAIIADVTPPAARGRAFGFHRAADHLGAVAGSIAAWALLQREVPLRDVIAWSVVPGLLTVLVLALVLRGAPPSAEPAHPDGHAGQPLEAPLRWAPVLALAGLVLMRMPEALLLLRLQELEVALPAIPLVWAALHVVRTAATYPGGWLSDHAAPRGLVAAGGLLTAAIALLLGQALAPAAAVAVFLAFGLVAGCTEAAERVIVARLQPKRMGRSFGAYHALTGLAALPAGLGFGAVYEQAGAAPALWASAAGMALASGAWLVTAGRKEGTA